MIALLPVLLLGATAAAPAPVSITWRPDGTALICSEHIRVTAPAVPVPIVPIDALGQSMLLTRILTDRDRDDQRTYGLSTDQIRAEAQRTPRGEPYLDSEQHRVFAALASARTGEVIPAEFFQLIDPFGGTAGNGPLIQPGGGAGQLLSTIGLIHDADWLIGRHLAAGPLAALADLPDAEPRYLGLVGLTDSRHAATWVRADLLNPFRRGPSEAERAALDSLEGQFYLGTRGDARFSLSPDNPAGVWVQLREDYVRAHNRGRLDSATPLPGHARVPFPPDTLWPADEPCEGPATAAVDGEVH